MAKRNRSRRAKASAADQGRRPAETPWSDVEEAFFASAPPDDPVAVAVESLEDDDAVAAAAPASPLDRTRRQLVAALRRVVADLVTAPWLNRRNVTIAIASLMLLVGLSAVVFASR